MFTVHVRQAIIDDTYVGGVHTKRSGVTLIQRKRRDGGTLAGRVMMSFMSVLAGFVCGSCG